MNLNTKIAPLLNERRLKVDKQEETTEFYIGYIIGLMDVYKCDEVDVLAEDIDSLLRKAMSDFLLDSRKIIYKEVKNGCKRETPEIDRKD